MTKSFLNILFCDDDSQFARTQVADLNHQLTIKHGILPTTCILQPMTNLAALRKLAKDPAQALQWDACFCDLGWGDFSMEGIQILHDIQMNNPHIYTVLFTAQDENEFIGQALEWKFHFIDKVLKVGDKQFFNKTAQTILDLFYAKDEGSLGKDIQLSGARMLPATTRDLFLTKAAQELKQLQTFFTGLLKVDKNQKLALDISISSEGMQMKLKQDPSSKRPIIYQELLDKLERFPEIEANDLLALSKAAYIEFVQKKYGGFPQMALERGLDLNNIYRVNRRFKNAPFIVFKYETIQEIVASYNTGESSEEIRKLLCPPALLRKIMQA